MAYHVVTLSISVNLDIEWTSVAAARAYQSSKLASSLGAHETLAFVTSSPQVWHLVLGAPCTEVFTAFGVEEGFAENVGRFVGAVDGDAPEGYRGAAFGESVDLEEDGNGDGGEKAVRMVIGWTSREAHLEAKGKPGGEFTSAPSVQCECEV
jgi:hypothetical protein